LLKPVTFFIVVMGVIGTFQLFDQSYIFSAGSGGPNNSTLTIVLLIYQYAFKSLDMGLCSRPGFDACRCDYGSNAYPALLL
jgi:multiple sugar transport system permease protein